MRNEIQQMNSDETIQHNVYNGKLISKNKK